MTSQGDISSQNGDVETIVIFLAQGIVHEALNMVNEGSIGFRP